jgi:hypothetical protein
METTFSDALLRGEIRIRQLYIVVNGTLRCKAHNELTKINSISLRIYTLGYIIPPKKYSICKSWQTAQKVTQVGHADIEIC